MWVICDMHTAPWACTPSARARSAASFCGSHNDTDPYEAALSGSTDADPKVITSPTPPAALRTW
jgi:hypothetical protein